MYGFCSSNALYSASFSFRMLLLFQIKSQPDVACKSVCYKRAFNVIFQSSKNWEITFLHEFIFSSSVLLGWYCWKSLAKSREFEKNIKREMAIQTFYALMLRGWKGEPWSPELLGGPKLEGGTWFEMGYLRPLFIPWESLVGTRYVSYQIRSVISCYQFHLQHAR